MKVDYWKDKRDTRLGKHESWLRFKLRKWEIWTRTDFYEPHCILPWYLGRVYIDFLSNHTVLAVVPLNFIARWVRTCFMWLRWGPYPGTEERMLRHRVEALKRRIEYLEHMQDMRNRLLNDQRERIIELEQGSGRARVQAD